MQLLIACDKFKGCLTSKEVNEALAVGINRAALKHKRHVLLVTSNVSDGGEGFLDCVAFQQGFQRIRSLTLSPEHASLYADWGLDKEKNAWIESALICGHQQIKNRPLNPLSYTSQGIGLMIETVKKHGAKHIYMGLGSSAIVDAGMGALQVLKKAKQIPPITFVADVENALLDTACLQTKIENRGALAVYGPQKGLSSSGIHMLEAKYAIDFERRGKTHLLYQKYGGAAGGLGLGISLVSTTNWISGSRWCIAFMGLAEKVKQSDGVVIGEGCVDKSSLEGKITGEIYRLAQKLKKPVYWVCGQYAPDIPGQIKNACAALTDYTGANHNVSLDSERAQKGLQLMGQRLFHVFEQLADHRSVSEDI